MLGYCRLRSIEEFKDWYGKNGTGCRKMDSEKNLCGNWYYDRWTSFFFARQGKYKDTRNMFEHNESFFDHGTEHYNDFLEMVDYLEKTGEKLVCFDREGEVSVVGYGKKKYIVPTEEFKFEDLRSYDELTAQEMKLISGSSKSLPSESGGVTLRKAREESDAVTEQIKDVRKEMEEVSSGKAKELEEIKKQMEELERQMKEKQKILMAELQEKMDAMELQKKRWRCRSSSWTRRSTAYAA